MPDFREDKGCQHKPGEWVDSPGRELTFDEAALRVGQLVLLDMSTKSHAWYQVCLLEKVVPYEGMRRLILYDGHKQRDLVNEHFFRPQYSGNYPSRVYELP